MPVKPILDDLELQQVQKVEAEERESVSRHSVPGLEGDFLQDLGRRAVRITLNGVLTGPDSGDGLKHLREKFQKAEPVSFVNDIATATSVDKVLIEAMDIREIAGKPERFEYGIAIREFIPPPPPQVVPPPPIPPKPKVDKATLVVEVIVDGQPNFDFSTVTATAAITPSDGTKPSSLTLTNRTDNQWTETELPAGQVAVTATVSTPPAMSGAASGALQAGQTTKLTIHLTPGVVIAQTFVVHFALDKAFVEPCMRHVLRDVSDFARNNPTAKLLIVGNTDEVGSPTVLTAQDPYNQSLSERRGRSVYAFLTFNRDSAEAMTEWKELRKNKTVSNPTINDNWGLTQVQYMLQDLDFYPGAVDGQDGPLTREAIRAFRCHVGLPPGNTMDEQTWEALIQAYLGKDPQIVVPASQYFTNCPGEILKWTGVATQDPVKRVGVAFRPNRRVELLFVHVDKLPCTIPKPDTFDLPVPGAVGSDWCVGDGDKTNRPCFVVKHLPKGGQPKGNEWLRQPAQPGTITVHGSIAFDNGKPYANKKFALIAPDGLNEQDENGSTGKPVAARTNDKGEFTLPKDGELPVGWYSLEVQNDKDVVVRLKENDAGTATGPAVCKFLQSDTDSLDVVILADPVLREIRLPVVTHLMTALHPLTRAVRTCPSAVGPPARQATAHTDDEVRAAFATANEIWRQARVHFELTDIVHETYAFRVECEIDGNEFAFLLDRANDSFPQVVNVFFVGDLAGTAEAGIAISVEDGAGLGIAGCAVGDRFQFTALGPPLNVSLDADQTAQVLAHELGHYLSLPHADDTSANANRLMLPGTAAGDNRTLTADEVKKARASKGANDDCVPLTLKVTGATTTGGSLSNRFIVIQGSPGPVTVEAQIPDRMLDPSVGALTMTGGDSGDNKHQVVNTGTNRPVEVVATYTPAGGGQPVTRHVFILVSSFPPLRVDGAAPVGGAGSTTFVCIPGQLVTLHADLDPAPFAIPSDLIKWSAGAAVDDPQQHTVTLAPTKQIVVSATIASVTRSATIGAPLVEVVADPTGAAPALTFVRFALWDNAFRAPGDPLGLLFNEELEANNFVGADTRKFHIRVTDPTATNTGHVQTEWKTLDQNNNDLDAPAIRDVTLVETPANSGVFISRGVMVVTDADDQNQATHSGLSGTLPDAGLVVPSGARNHRIRRASMLGHIRIEYKPAPPIVLPVELPVFARNPESRRRLPLQIFVLRVAAGGAGVVPTAPGSPIWTVELRQIREVYERLGIAVATVVAAGTPAGDVVTFAGDSLVLITPPAGVNPLSVTLADEGTIGAAFPPLAATTRVFYTGGLADGNRGEAWPDVDFAGRPQQGAVFVNRVAPTYNAAHEIGHVLTDKRSAANGGHYKEPAVPAGNRLHNNQNLMRNGTSVVEGVTESKRLWDAADGDGLNQFSAIVVRPSRYTRNF